MLPAPLIRIKRLRENARFPAYAHPGDAGMDVFAAESKELGPGERGLVKTGFALELPEGMECQVRPKSGLAIHHGITLLNTPGTIDSGYRGEVQIIVINLGREPYSIKEGEKIAQLVFARVEKVSLEESQGELSESSRGPGGFGSTGKT